MIPLHKRSDSGSSGTQQQRRTAATVERVSPSTGRTGGVSPNLDDFEALSTRASPSSVSREAQRDAPLHAAAPWRYSLGAASQALVAFCVLNGLLGLLFSQMFRNQHISFQLAAMHHGWSEEQKAKGCHNAAMGYFILAALTILNPVISQYVGTPSSWFCKAKQNARNGCRRFVPKERLSLLGYSRKGSDDSCDEEDAEEMRSGGGVSSGSRKSSRTAII
jgi:hypothetical protein